MRLRPDLTAKFFLKSNAESERVSHSVVPDSDPMGCGPPGSSIHGVLQVRILEWVAISFSRGPSQPRDPTPVSRTAIGHFTA